MDSPDWNDLFSPAELAAAVRVHAYKLAKMHGCYGISEDILHAARIDERHARAGLLRTRDDDRLGAARHHGLGLLAWSSLGRGALTGKYRTGIPRDSRAAAESPATCSTVPRRSTTSAPATAGAKWNGPYLKKGVPPDPWGQPYQYKAPGTRGDYEITSLGKDGQPGGTADSGARSSFTHGTGSHNLAAGQPRQGGQQSDLGRNSRGGVGGSQGGREGLTVAQRYPQDYDGVIANEPALNYTGTRLSNVAVGRALYSNGGANEQIGLMHWDLGGYRPSDIRVVAAWDIDRRKVGRDVNEAIFAKPNCTAVFCDHVPETGVEVRMGRMLDVYSPHMIRTMMNGRGSLADPRPFRHRKALKIWASRRVSRVSRVCSC